MERIDRGETTSRSLDLRRANVDLLATVFPDVVVDGAVDFLRLRELLDESVNGPDEKFGLTWSGKSRALQLALTPSTGTLRPTSDTGEASDSGGNVLLEGDNLEVLKLLLKSYSGRVKLIYIDPPYNTGSDFVYPDDFTDGIGNYLAVTGQVGEDGLRVATSTESAGRFHTRWLSMMYPRLRLARDLLSDDGVLCVSIDGNEVAHLRVLMEEVFGASNFVSTIVWVSNLKGRQISGGGPAGTHEYLLCAARDAEAIDQFRGSRATLQALMPAIYKGTEYEVKRDAVGDFITKNQLYNTNSKFNEATSPTMVFRIHYNPSTGEVRTTDLDDETNFQGFVVAMPHPNARAGVEWHAWRWSRKRIVEEAQDLEFEVVDGALRIWTKIRDIDGITMKDIVLGPNTVTGQADLEGLEMGRVFDTPKPVALIQSLVGVATGPDALVMDFFAGSGTTGHAVMAQNAADGGNRRFILVQLPEPLDPANKAQKSAADFCDQLGVPRNIAELTKERLRRAGEKVKADTPDFDGDVGFRVYRLDSSNIRTWDPDATDLEGTIDQYIDQIKPDRSDDDLQTEVLLKLGIELTTPVQVREIAGKSVSSVGAGALITCFDTSITADEVEELARGIVEWLDELQTAGDSTVIFRDSAFDGDVAKTNLSEMLVQHGVARENVRSL